MVKLVIGPRFPYVSLSDVGLREQVEVLRKENEDLRERVIAAQQQKSIAQSQADLLRREKERLRLKVVSLNQAARAQLKVQETQQAKIQALRQELEEFRQL